MGGPWGTYFQAQEEEEEEEMQVMWRWVRSVVSCYVCAQYICGKLSWWFHFGV